MNKWFYFNAAVFLIAIWQVFRMFPLIPTHVWIGFFGLVLILFNWTRHAVFSSIRDTPDRAKKIKLANLSKKVMPFHRWVGSTALVVISIHAFLVLDLYGLHWKNLKLISGMLTGFVLIAMVTTGWMRLIKPTGKKRKAHLYLGLTLFCLVALHVVF